MPTSAETDAGPSKVYLDAPYASIRWEAEGQWVLTEWKRRATGPEFRMVQERTLGAIAENHASRFLLDVRNLKVVLAGDAKWVRDSVVPRFKRAGLRRIATVLPSNRLIRADLFDVTRTPASGELQRADFGTLEEARAWLSFVGTAD
jgi:hypothetical protein